MNRYYNKARSWASLLLIAIASIAPIGNANAQSTATLTQVVDKSTPTLSATSSLNPSTFGQSVTLTATLTAPLSSMATGTVQWFDGATSIGSPIAVTSGSSSFTTASLGAGTHSLTAAYSGDSNFNAATSPVLNQVVGQATPGFGGFAPISIASSLNPSVYQNSVTFTASVPAGATGSIVFMDGLTALGTVPISGNTAAFSIQSLVAGAHSITAVYSGDSNFLSATSTALDQVVQKAPTVESVFATPSTGLNVGSGVMLTALVNTGMFKPTGSVTFMDGAKTLGSAAVTATTATNLLPYSSDFTQWTSDSSGTAPTVGSATLGPDGASSSATTINYPDTTGGGTYAGLKLTAAGNYAAQQMAVSFWAKSTYGTKLTVNLTDGSGANLQTAAVTTSNTWQRYVLPLTLPGSSSTNAILSIRVANQGTGSVAFYGAQLEQAPTAGVFVMTRGASATGQGGIATYTTSTLLEGSHPINVSYTGDSNYLPNTGDLNPALAVGKGTAAVTVVSSSPSIAYGQPVTFTANVSGPATTPTGTVTFYDGAAAIGTGTLDSSGNATLSTTSLAVGSHSITVQYAGDVNFDAATSPAITQTVVIASAAVTVSSSVNPSTFGQSIDLEVIVAGAGAVPTGRIAVTDGATTLGTLTLDASGKAHLTTSTLTAGSHDLSFSYSGDSNYK